MTALRSHLGFPSLVQAFFCDRLVSQRDVSPRTVASYRDTFRLLLTFAERRLRKSPAAMSLAELDAPLVLDFLTHLENERSNAPRTRNLRLTAIRSFMKYAASTDPTTLPVAQHVLAIPSKRFDHPLVGFLSREEMDAVLAAPDDRTWSGRRDRVLLSTLYNSGARVSEIVAVCRQDVTFGRTAAIRLHGKGRKERAVPLWKTTADALRKWTTELPDSPEQPLFPNRSRRAMTRSGVEDRLDAAVRTASRSCPSLLKRNVSPHIVRHTTAMHLLQAGVDITVIALWLGHESPVTTHMYVEADLKMKEHALAKVQAANAGIARYRPNDKLLAFLDSL
jgi:integrase/recombinase XerD